MSRRIGLSGLALSVSLITTAADAQPLGTFRWQLQPFCNAVIVSVIQQGAVYTVDGYDDQCGASQRAPLVGLATPNPDGSIGLGLNVVTVPGGRGVQIDARISLATLGGTWSDSAGNAGTFAFNATTGGSPRPAPAAIPSTISLFTSGGILARGTLDSSPVSVSGAGTRMMWHPGKSAWRVGTVSAGQWDDANVGLLSSAFGLDTIASHDGSTAFGVATRASGLFSTAFGSETVASGTLSTALGSSTRATESFATAFGLATTASGESSTAFGSFTTASGRDSTAIGNQARALGDQSVAMGQQTVATAARAVALGDSSQANGDNSLAVGFGARANGAEAIAMGLATTTIASGGVALGSNATAAGGSFVFGDRSTSNVVSTGVPNQFTVRASGGVSFYTNTTLTTGLELANGGSQWLLPSDVNLKHEFRDLDGEDVLAKLSRMPVMEWSYRAQDATVRHVGPTAQDFRAAFGLGEHPLRIGTLDIDGIALVAVKALEARTRSLDERNSRLDCENQELRERLATLEALVKR